MRAQPPLCSALRGRSARAASAGAPAKKLQREGNRRQPMLSCTPVLSVLLAWSASMRSATTAATSTCSRKPSSDMDGADGLRCSYFVAALSCLTSPILKKTLSSLHTTGYWEHFCKNARRYVEHHVDVLSPRLLRHVGLVRTTCWQRLQDITVGILRIRCSPYGTEAGTSDP